MSWLAALTLAFLASSSSQLGWLLLFCAIPLITIWLETRRRGIRFERLFLILAGFVILVRVGFRVIFGQSQATGGAGWSLPDIQLNLGWLGELHLLGFVSIDSILAGFTDGLRLAAIVLAVAMASQLVSARALLRHTPAALYELSTAVSISVNLAPQLIKSLARVRQARLLRGRSRKVSLLASIVIPVLEDTIDQSLSLAASMDARGFGIFTGQSRPKLRALLGSAFVLVAIGVYLLLTGITWAAYLTIGLALASTALVIRAASRSSVRTVAHPLVWSLADRLVLVGLAALIVVRVAGWWQP